MFDLEDIFPATSHVFESTESFGSRRSTPSNVSANVVVRPSPQIHQRTTTTTPSTSNIVRNAVLVNNVQSRTQLRHAIHTFSRDFRLRGQIVSGEALLSPLIYRCASMQHAVYANAIFQSEEAKPTHDAAALHARHYNTALTLLQTTVHDPSQNEENVGTLIALAFYDICAGDVDHWTTHMADAANQIRIRGQTVDSRPLSLSTKYLFALFARSEVVGANAVCHPARTDRELLNVVYSGVPITSKPLLPYRIELELLFAQLSALQYECSQLPSHTTGWRSQQDDQRLTQRYHDLVHRLQQWKGVDTQLVTFEEAVGEYTHGSVVPPEMGAPLICV
jgi:hypothetical protein